MLTGKAKVMFEKLQRELPVDLPVVVRVRAMPGHHGTAEKLEGYYRITVEISKCGECRLDTLVHEWAHLMTRWDAAEHGPSWGVNYAKAYSCVLA